MLTLVLRQLCRWLSILFVCLCLAVVNNGCQKTTPTENAEGRMRRLFNPLIDYLEITTREEKGPPTEEGFKAFLGSLSKQKKSDLGITDTQEIFVSPRDQKPFVLNYRLSIEGGATLPAIWEQTGVNGQRCVYYQDGKFEELDEENFNKTLTKWKK